MCKSTERRHLTFVLRVTRAGVLEILALLQRPRTRSPVPPFILAAVARQGVGWSLNSSSNLKVIYSIFTFAEKLRARVIFLPQNWAAATGTRPSTCWFNSTQSSTVPWWIRITVSKSQTPWTGDSDSGRFADGIRWQFESWSKFII